METNDHPNGEPEDSSNYRPLQPLGKHDKTALHDRAKAFDDRSSVGAAPVRQVSFAGKPQRSRKPFIIGGIIVALLLAVYVSVAVYFTFHFMPNTKIAGSDVSLMSATEAEDVVVGVVDAYQFSLQGQGLKLSLKGSDLASSHSAAEVAREAMAAENPWAWPIEITQQHDQTQKLSLAFSDLKVKDAVREAVDAYNSSAIDPVNANIAFDKTKGAYVVTPEKIGTKLDADMLVDAAWKAVSSLSPSMTVGDDFLQKPTIFSDDARLTAAVGSANALIAADFSLMMGKDKAAQVDASLISQWVKLGDDFSVAFDDAALTAWANDLAKACNTVGTTRTYTRADGKAISVSGGVYGWEVKTDELLAQVKEGVATGRREALEIPCGAKGDAYNGAGKRDWGNRYMDVDLTEQHARFYDESGAIIWESDIVTGIPDGEHDTPTGVYWVNRKASPSILSGYQGETNTYNTEVQYWMPFVGDAVGFHDAEWQSAFGGTRYKDGFGSHGCVNLPTEKAKELYALLVEADTVVCHW
ncbi:MAG: L,D-transpeptidase family protein [Gordonibacter sp.]|nr:L,D-transpeptidase family protein [Gordonibacter sp.]